jgi:hypothetical protein
LAGALMSVFRDVLNTLPIELRNSTRIAMRPMATSAMMSAYSVRP